MTSCIICDLRPAKHNGICNNCAQKLAADRRRSKNAELKTIKYLHYQGTVAALVQIDRDTFRAVRSKRSVDNLPKSKVIDLDNYCDGYTRDIIKRFKAAVLRLSGV